VLRGGAGGGVGAEAEEVELHGRRSGRHGWCGVE
jgi:hypothetical protein